MQRSLSRRRLRAVVALALAVAGTALVVIPTLTGTGRRGAAPRTAPHPNRVSGSPHIFRIPIDDGSNVPFPSGIIGATTVYEVSFGRTTRMVFGGGAGCHYGRADSCLRDGNRDFLRTGMIIDQTYDNVGLDDDLGAPILVPGTGGITFTRSAGTTIFFRTDVGRSGSYSLATRTVTLH